MTETRPDPTPILAAHSNRQLESLRAYVPLAAWLIIVVTVLFIPLKIIGYGYLPPDDALRHAANRSRWIFNSAGI